MLHRHDSGTHPKTQFTSGTAGAVRPTPAPLLPGQESVWDYPRPPSAVQVKDRIVVEHAGVRVADTTRGWKVMETASPPTYYIPPGDVVEGLLKRGQGRSWCEWKGRATYWDLHVPGAPVVEAAAWSYETPSPDYPMLESHLAFYPGRVDRCVLAGEVVRPQPGRFYGGWITDAIAGPWKGEPGSELW